MIAPMRLLPLAFVAALVACGSDAAAPNPPDSSRPTTNATILSGTASSLHQQEVALVQTPSSRIVAAWMGYTGTFSTIEYAISDDAGATWGAAVTLPPPSTVYGALYDPALATDAHGNVTLAVLRGGPHFEILTYRLASAATAFDSPTIVDSLNANGNQLDKTQIVTTDSGLLVTYSHIEYVNGLAGPGTIGLAARSADGLRWTIDTLPAEQPLLMTPCASGPNVTISYNKPLGRGGVWAMSSHDGGASWSAPTQVSTANAAYTFAVTQCVQRGSEAWVLSAAADSAPLTLVHSPQEGVAFSRLATVDTAGGLNPQLFVRPDGAIDVWYYTTGSAQRFVHALLPAGAPAFQPAETIRGGLPTMTTAEASRVGQTGIGDYISAVPNGVAFTDNSSGTSHIVFLRGP